MKIHILGSTGMLGQYVSKYLTQHYEVGIISKSDVDASKLHEEELHAKLHNLNVRKGDVIINCIGTIKPMVDALGDLNAIRVNSIFPRVLANVCEKMEVKMIHPTTDCVFTGEKGSYVESDKHDITDVYGRTKSLGEPSNCTVIRTSIIGEEVNQGRSLVEWIKSQNNKTVFGFTNHIWNGITCLQFAKVCSYIIQNNLFWNGTKHIHSNTVTKYELLNSIISSYNLTIEVIAKEDTKHCDRSLSSNVDFCKNLNLPDLNVQIQEMENFGPILYC